MLGFTDRDTDTVHHSTGKVIGDQAGPDFLGNERSLFRVEFGETNSILQVAKRGFDRGRGFERLIEAIEDITECRRT